MTKPTAPYPADAAERPTPARRRARPAADDGHDPVDPAPARPSPPSSTGEEPARSTTRPARGRRGPEPTVQLNTRVSQDVRSLVDDVVADTGQSLRDVVEHALRQTYRST